MKIQIDFGQFSGVDKIVFPGIMSYIKFFSDFSEFVLNRQTLSKSVMAMSMGSSAGVLEMKRHRFLMGIDSRR